MDDKVKYWVDIAEYDLETARAMLEAGRYLYVTLMCHQTIEKILKAYYQLINNDLPPKTHNLLLLCDKTGLLVKLDQDQSAFLDVLNPLNIQARNPEHRERISFHPEMALLCDLGVNLRDFLCGIHCVCLRAIP